MEQRFSFKQILHKQIALLVDDCYPGNPRVSLIKEDLDRKARTAAAMIAGAFRMVEYNKRAQDIRRYYLDYADILASLPDAAHAAFIVLHVGSLGNIMSEWGIHVRKNGNASRVALEFMKVHEPGTFLAPDFLSGANAVLSNAFPSAWPGARCLAESWDPDKRMGLVETCAALIAANDACAPQEAEAMTVSAFGPRDPGVEGAWPAAFFKAHILAARRRVGGAPEAACLAAPVEPSISHLALGRDRAPDAPTARSVSHAETSTDDFVSSPPPPVACGW